MLIALFEPEIPPNTGNIARLCAAYDVELHLIGKLGFKLEDRYLKRAGLDYWPHVRLFTWPSWAEFRGRPARPERERHILATTKASVLLPDFVFKSDDAIILGPETRGLPNNILDDSPWRVRIPVRRMEAGGVRSLNLSTAAGILLYSGLLSSGEIKNFS